MKILLLILFFSFKSFSQDSIKVKILKVRGNQVWMKTLERPRVKLFSYCKCPYRKGEIIRIKKPSL